MRFGTSAGPVGAGRFGGGVANVVGPYSTSVPGPTGGTPLVLPGGVLRAICNTTAFSAVNTGITVEVYLDGVIVSTMRLNPGHPVSLHVALSTLTFQANISAGTHYFGFRTVAGATNSDDFGSVLAIVTPA